MCVINLITNESKVFSNSNELSVNGKKYNIKLKFNLTITIEKRVKSIIQLPVTHTRTIQIDNHNMDYSKS